MFRKIYFDLIRKRIAQKDLGWLFRRCLQYLLIQSSFALGRPLCGPILGTLITNYKCNYRCKMCEMPQKEELIKEKGCKELSTAQLKRVIKDFADLGISGIGFTGGEPLLRSDIFELLKYSKDSGLITHINTNGFFVDEENAKKLIEAGIDSINISLDGARPETHDSIRGYKGAFDRVISALQNINAVREKSAAPVRLKLVTVISENNIDEVEDLIKLSVDLKTDCIEFIPEQNFISASKLRISVFKEVFLKKANLTIKRLLNLKRKGAKIENSFRHLRLFEKSFKNMPSPVTCFAGYNSYTVDCYGEIYPCLPSANWGKPIGNLKEKPLKEFWYSKEYNGLRGGISKCRKCYLNCQSELNILFNIG